MRKMDFETLVLSRAELKNLKLISKGPVANNEEWAHRLNELLDLGFVEVQMYLDESKIWPRYSAYPRWGRDTSNI